MCNKYVDIEAFVCSDGCCSVCTCVWAAWCTVVLRGLFWGVCVSLWTWQFGHCLRDLLWSVYLCVYVWVNLALSSAPTELTWCFVAYVCMYVHTLSIMILPELPCCLPLCSYPVSWCSAAIQGSVLVGGQLGIIGTILAALIGCAAPASVVQLV